MKKKLVAALLSVTLAAGMLTGCGTKNTSDSSAQDAAAEEEKEEAVDDQKADEEAAGEKETGKEAAGESTSEVQALAKEYVTRHITPEDEISEEVIEALIGEIKAEYPFEEGITEIKVAQDDNSLIAEGKGWWEQLFGDAGIDVTIVEGAENFEEELMARGDLNFANRMLYPYLLNKEKGADLIAVWATETPAPEIVNVIVRSDSGYETFEDLKGKTIATSASSCPYVVAQELIQRAGWEVGKDVNVVNTQEYVNALLAGEVDAIIYHPTTPVNPILISGEAKVIANAPEDGVYVGGGGLRVIFTTNEFAETYPNITKAYLKLEEAIQAWEYVDTEEAANIYEQVSRIPAENVIYWWNVGKETRFSWTGTKDELQKVSERFYNWLIEYDVAFDGGADLEHLFADGYFE